MSEALPVPESRPLESRPLESRPLESRPLAASRSAGATLLSILPIGVAESLPPGRVAPRRHGPVPPACVLAFATACGLTIACGLSALAQNPPQSPPGTPQSPPGATQSPPGATQNADSPTASNTPLRALQELVGQWRGVGQVRRGSTRGAWQQQSDWQWKFNPQPALAFKTESAKYFRQGRLTFNPDSQKFQLDAVTNEGASIRYLGTRDEDQQLTLNVETDSKTGDSKTVPARIRLRMVAEGKRMVVLYERRVGESRYARLSEVGYTREGSQFGQGASFVECVVTGGLGTIAVTHQGQTYYVCCSGCRDYFNENPEEVLAEYRERKQQERQDRKEKENGKEKEKAASKEQQ